MSENIKDKSEIMEQELPTAETAEMTAEVHTEAAGDEIVEAGAVCDGADELIVDETAEAGEDELVVEEEAQPAKRSRKRSIALIAAIICLLAVAVGGTYAYFTAEKETFNIITMRGLDLVLHEEDEYGNEWGEAKEDEDGNKWREVTGVMPSNSVWKRVYVENYLEEGEPEEAKADFYTRVKVTLTAKNEAGETLADYADYINIDFNTEDWELGEDGYYYYMKDGGVVRPGEVTTPLMNYVSFDKTMPNAYQNAKVYVDIEAQATQSRNNPGSDPMDAATLW